MGNQSAMKQKGTITEGDTAILLNRYSATTVLALLHEVSKHASAKIDWNYLVKHTATGITNAREYQILWRHLAYRRELAERYEDDAQPLEDDSDLEFEIEPSPIVTSEALGEAAACVKVLASSGTLSESSHQGQAVLEAPLTINLPSSTNASNIQESNQQTIPGVNITVPVSIQKQQLPTVACSEGIDGNVSTSSSHPVRKKRKLWTLEEDNELIAAVQKCGEGNWSSILKGAFKHDRTASQLSQRWALIRKRQQATSGNTGTSLGVPEVSQSLAQAVPIAILPPSTPAAKGVGSSPNLTGQVTSSGLGSSLAQVSALSPSDKTHIQPNNATLVLDQVPDSNVAPSNFSSPLPSRKSKQNIKKQGTKSAITLPTTTFGKHTSISTKGPHPMVQAAAVAAGARIAPASAAASLFKAAQSGTVVQIGPGISMAKACHSTQSASTCMISSNSLSGSGFGNAKASGIHQMQTGSIQMHSDSSGMISGGQALPCIQSKNQGGKSSIATPGPSVSGTFALPSSSLTATTLGSSIVSESQTSNQKSQADNPVAFKASDETKCVKQQIATNQSQPNTFKCAVQTSNELPLQVPVANTPTSKEEIVIGIAHCSSATSSLTCSVLTSDQKCSDGISLSGNSTAQQDNDKNTEKVQCLQNSAISCGPDLESGGNVLAKQYTNADNTIIEPKNEV